MKTKFPSLQRKPKTAEQRKEEDEEGHSQKRSAESEIERQRRLTQDKEYQSRKRSAESEIDKEMRLNKQKEYNEKHFAESQIVCNLCNSSKHLCRICKNTVRNFCGEQDASSDNKMHIMHRKNDKRCKVGESQIERQRRLNKQKEYDNEKRSAESDIEKEMRQTQDKEYHRQKRSAESDIEIERRLTKDKSTKHKRYTQATQFREKDLLRFNWQDTSEMHYLHI